MGDPMSNSIKDQIAVLIKLQAVDNETRNLRSVLNSVDGQLDILTRDLHEFEQTCQSQKNKLESLRKTYRDREREGRGRRRGDGRLAVTFGGLSRSAEACVRFGAVGTITTDGRNVSGRTTIGVAKAEASFRTPKSCRLNPPCR